MADVQVRVLAHRLQRLAGRAAAQGAEGCLCRKVGSHLTPFLAAHAVEHAEQGGLRRGDAADDGRAAPAGLIRLCIDAAAQEVVLVHAPAPADVAHAGIGDLIIHEIPPADVSVI